jgi:hypothetical protein
MNRNILEFERPIIELEQKIEEMRKFLIALTFRTKL